MGLSAGLILRCGTICGYLYLDLGLHGGTRAATTPCADLCGRQRACYHRDARGHSNHRPASDLEKLLCVY
eukprot:1910801-Rhodomonas_salina.1